MPVLFQLSNVLEDRICLSAGRLANNALVWGVSLVCEMGTVGGGDDAAAFSFVS